MSSLSQFGLFDRLSRCKDPREAESLLAEWHRRQQVAAALDADCAWMDDLEVKQVAAPLPPDLLSRFRKFVRAKISTYVLGAREPHLQRDYDELLKINRLLVDKLDDRRRRHAEFRIVPRLEAILEIVEAMREFTTQDTVGLLAEETVRTHVERHLSDLDQDSIGYALRNPAWVAEDNRRLNNLKYDSETAYRCYLLIQKAERTSLEAADLLALDEAKVLGRLRYAKECYDERS